MITQQLLACAFIIAGVIVGYALGWRSANRANDQAVAAARHIHEYTPWAPTLVWGEQAVFHYRTVQQRTCRICGSTEQEVVPS